MNIGSKEIKINANETILVQVEEQTVPFFSRLLYKNISDCLVISIGDISYRFIVSEVMQVLEILEEEGLYKA